MIFNIYNREGGEGWRGGWRGFEKNRNVHNFRSKRTLCQSFTAVC